mgnify:FL=1|jgi:hypothetical protein|tara:strand:- start:6068 stop:6574 length:507 start_codon:yes stop_codon:yes gene_type:complete
MKKILLLFFVTSILISCDNTTKVTVEEEGPAPGYMISNGEKISARDANPANLEIWEKYIDAHNNKDLETIASMNNDSILVNAWDGRNIQGNNAHIEALQAWYDEGNPEWNIFFSYSMKVDGQKGEWVISGMEIKDTVDGKEVIVQDVTDAYIVDGKMRRIIVYRKENL